MRKRRLYILIIVMGGVFCGWEIFKPAPLIKNGDFAEELAHWDSNAGVSIFREPGARDWRYYFTMGQKVGLLHFGDIFNDRFAAIGAGNAVGSVLSQGVTLDGRGGSYELSFLFAATGDAGLTAVMDTSVADARGRVLAQKTLTNIQPVKMYFVPLNQQREEKLTFEVPAGTTLVKVSFADKSPNGGVAVDPLIKHVGLKKVK